MNIHPMHGKAPYYTNCFLVTEETPTVDGRRAAVLVDASVTPHQVEQQLEKDNAVLCAILLTHGHFDHVETLDELRKAYQVPVWLGSADVRQFGLQADCTYTDAPVTAGDLVLQPVAAPGHTPGSTCLLCGDVMFAGDTLFAGSVGRTDLPGGDGRVLCATLIRLCESITQDLQVLPGHGEFTTLSQEKLVNPYLRYALRTPGGSF